MRKLAKWFEEALESYVKLMGNTYGWGEDCKPWNIQKNRIK